MGRPTSIRTFSVIAILFLLAIANKAAAFTVTISDKDQLRQTCSGMVAGGDSHIEAFFHKGSTGTVATMFYEFEDFGRLGKLSSKTDAFGYRLKSFVCTPSAVTENLCTQKQLGNFIVDDSNGPASTVQLQRMDFGPSGTADEKTLVSPQADRSRPLRIEAMLTSSETPFIQIKQRYNVTKTGYYCFGASELLPFPGFSSSRPCTH